MNKPILKFIFFFSFLLFFQLSSIAQIGKIDTAFNTFTAFNGSIQSCKVQANGKILIGGHISLYYNRPIFNIVRLNLDGTVDNTFRTDVGTNSGVNSIIIQPDSNILIAGAFTYYDGQPFNRIMRLLPSGVPDMSFNPGQGANNQISKLYLQADGKIIIVGSFTSYDGNSNNGICRINSNGSIDNTFNVAANGTITCLHILNDNKILIGGNFTKLNGINKNRMGRLFSDGSLDSLFKVNYGFDKTVNVIRQQADDKILAGGGFKMYDSTSSSCLVRLDTNGTRDTSFHVGSGFFHGGFVGMNNQTVYDILIQPDQKIIIGGWYQSYNGTSHGDMVRLNSDGTIDNTFITTTDTYSNAVTGLTLQPDSNIILCGNFNTINNVKRGNCGRVLAATGALDNGFLIAKGPAGSISSISTTLSGKAILTGSFNSYNGILNNKIVLLDSKGRPDLSFNSGTGFNHNTSNAVIQPDGKIIVAGSFTSYNSNSANYIIRLDSVGNVDNTFNTGSGFDNATSKIIVQVDGKIIVIGSFTSYNGTGAIRVVRLNQDGTIDLTFITGTSFNNTIADIAIQPDQKIIFAGLFTSYNGTTCNGMARLNTDGSLDNTFNVGTGPSGDVINSIGILPSGYILVGGYFTGFNGTSSEKLIRLTANGAIDLSFGTFNYSVLYILVDPGGFIYLGVQFPTSYDGTGGLGWSRLIKLLPNGNNDASFQPDFFNEVSRCYKIGLYNNGDVLTYGSFNNPWINEFCKVFGNPSGYNTINSRIYTDRDANCSFGIKDKFLPQIIFRATPGNFYGVSDWYGQVALKVDSGTHTYKVEPVFNPIEQRLLISQCPNQSYYNISAYGKDKTFTSGNFADSVKQCRLMDVEIEKIRMRPCVKSPTYISYINHGNVQANNVQLRVIYPSQMTPLSSIPAWTTKTDSLLIYDLNSVNPLSGGDIIIMDSVSCIQAISGFTKCIRADISPETDCDAVNNSWDKSSISVSGYCLNSKSHFIIENDGTGDMADSSQYRVFQNDTLIYFKNFRLISGSQLIVDVNSFNKTIRLEADQRPYHPGSSLPRAFVEGCGTGTFTPGFVNSAPQDERDEETACVCRDIRNSYDPNEKVAFPEGASNFHYIKSSDKINYTINFQNTGTDIAYIVRVVDTLDANLDISTFIAGISSHRYTLKVDGKGRPIISFVFNNIFLPDSSTNNEGSQGFIKFSIKPLSTLAPGSIILNNANIYFDYNSPVTTNTVTHKITDSTVTDLSQGANVSELGVITGFSNRSFTQSLIEVYPNPADNFINVKIIKSQSGLRFRLLAIDGVCLLDENLNENINLFNLNKFKKGLYLYEIKSESEFIQVGKLIIN